MQKIEHKNGAAILMHLTLDADLRMEPLTPFTRMQPRQRRLHSLVLRGLFQSPSLLLNSNYSKMISQVSSVKCE